jgi:ribosomal-protein-alanine N-acetyltransferase
MPPSETGPIRAILETDRPWAAYALGDLASPEWERCEWHVAPGDPPALLLLYRGFAVPVLFAFGPPAAVRALLPDLDELEVALSVRPEIEPVVRECFAVCDDTPMWRMLFDPARFPGGRAGAAERLTAADLPAVRRLYADGAAQGIAPDCFQAEMLHRGVFYGIREGAELTAVAGTHLVVPAESVGAVGNVYTRSDQRGRGLATRVTGAVTAELLGLGIETIVLNVDQENAPAIRVYERLGYRRYCPFLEGMARVP